jgi:hypothetical protein
MTQPRDEAEDFNILLNAYATVRELPAFTFPHAKLTSRNLSDPELAPHLRGLMGYVASRGDREMTTGRYQLLLHAQRTRHHVTFWFSDEEEAAVDALMDWARRANAVFFTMNGAIHDAALEVVLNADGAFEQEGLRMLPDAEERRERSIAKLGDVGRLLPSTMGPSLAVEEVELRSPAEVLDRCRALVHLLEVTDWALSDRSAPAPELPDGLAFTEEERAFIEAEPVDLPTAEQLSWRGYALRTLVWSLNPDAPALELPFNWERLGSDLDALERQGDRLELRSTGEILDALDLTWRQHWFAREAQLKEKESPFSHDEVMERHHALNWLTGFQNLPGTGWDDIQTPT